MAEARTTDEEKAISIQIAPTATPSSPSDPAAPQPQSLWHKWNSKISTLTGLETRGLERVPTTERLAASRRHYLEMLLLWLSANMTIICTLAAVTGPVIFQLGFTDCVLCVVFGTLLGAMSTAYMSTWGAVSGARMMVVARFVMGWWPAKLCAVLNVVLMVGYVTLDNIVGGQVLSAVDGGGMSIAVGVVVVAVIVCVLAVFGLKIFNQYQRYVFLSPSRTFSEIHVH